MTDRPRIAKDVCVVAAVVGIAAALRLAGLGSRPLWYDEIAHLEYAASFWRDIFAGSPVVAEPLFLSFLALWESLSHGEVWLRLPAVAMGCGGAVLGMLLGRRLAGQRAALGGGLAIAAAPFLVYYGRDAKMYAWVACFELALAWLALDHAQGRRGVWRSAGFIMTALALVYTHLASPLYLAALSLAYLIFFVRSLRQTFHWLLLQALVLAGLVPWALMLWRGYSELGAIRYWIPPPVPQSVFIFARNAAAGYAATDLVRWGGIAVLVLGLAAALAFSKRRSALFLLAVSAVQVALFYAVSHAGPRSYFIDRYLIGSAALAAVLIGAGIAAIPWTAPRLLAAAAALLIAGGGLADMAALNLSPRVRDHLGVYRPVDAFALRDAVRTRGEPGQPLWHTEWHALVQARWYLPEREHVLVDMGGRLAHDLAATAKPSVEQAALSAPVEIEHAPRGAGVVWLVMPRHATSRLGYADGIRAWVAARASITGPRWPGREGYAPLRLDHADFAEPPPLAAPPCATVRTGQQSGEWLAHQPAHVNVKTSDWRLGYADRHAVLAEVRSQSAAPVQLYVEAFPGVYLIPAAAFERSPGATDSWRLQPFRDRTAARMAYHAWVRKHADPGPLTASYSLPPGAYRVWLYRLAEGNGIPSAAAWRLGLNGHMYDVPAGAAAGQGWTRTLTGEWSQAEQGEVEIVVEPYREPGRAEACAAFAFLAFAPRDPQPTAAQDKLEEVGLSTSPNPIVDYPLESININPWRLYGRSVDLYWLPYQFHLMVSSEVDSALVQLHIGPGE